VLLVRTASATGVLYLKLQEAEERFGGCMPKMIWLNSAKNAIVDLTPCDQVGLREPFPGSDFETLETFGLWPDWHRTEVL
jgi:hypothetical protein